MKIWTFLFGIIVVLTTRLYGQEQLTKRQQADRAFERYEYDKSLALYLQLEGNKKYDSKILQRIADCYRKMNRYGEAENWYSKVVDDANTDIINSYYYAEMLLRDQKFKEAKNQYQAYFSKVGNIAQQKVKLATCDSAALLIERSSAYAIQNEEKFNTAYSDWGLTYYGSGFVFTSDRKPDGDNKHRGTYSWTGNGYFKLYKSNGDKITELPLNKKNELLNGDYHVGPVVFNASADTAYITITTIVPTRKLGVDTDKTTAKQRLYTRRLQLVIATKNGDKWLYFKNFTYNNVQQYSIGHAALSKSGNLLYFTSDMPGGYGGTDIWYCEKQANGGWAKPVNCGATVNTNGDEAFATISGDNLFYSSTGLPGIGGYDIFKATGQKSNWNKPEHLPYPMNSSCDDFGYQSKNGGLSGYFSSNRQNGKGDDDIYSFTYTPPEIIVRKPQPNLIATTVVPIPPQVVQPEIGKPFILKNIYYDLDKSNIRVDAALVLDNIVTLLKQNPTMRIELASHTDSRASDAYNLALSERRAASAVAYLVKQGINKNRLKAKGYGETQLINQCTNGVQCTEAQHQQNRRTEVTVISK